MLQGKLRLMDVWNLIRDSLVKFSKNSVFRVLLWLKCSVKVIIQWASSVVLSNEHCYSKPFKSITVDFGINFVRQVTLVYQLPAPPIGTTAWPGIGNLFTGKFYVKLGVLGLIYACWCSVLHTKGLQSPVRPRKFVYQWKVSKIFIILSQVYSFSWKTKK